MNKEKAVAGFILGVLEVAVLLVQYIFVLKGDGLFLNGILYMTPVIKDCLDFLVCPEDAPDRRYMRIFNLVVLVIALASVIIGFVNLDASADGWRGIFLDIAMVAVPLRCVCSCIWYYKSIKG